jgi:hypothetical protein
VGQLGEADHRVEDVAAVEVHRWLEPEEAFPDEAEEEVVVAVALSVGAAADVVEAAQVVH